MTDSSQTKLRNRSRRRLVRHTLITPIVLAAVVTASSVAAITVVVFDPGQYAENLRQVLAVLDQIDRANTQIQNQWRMLRRLPISVSRSLGIAGDRLVKSLRPALPLPAIDLGELFGLTESEFPTEFDGTDADWLRDQRPIWTESARANTVAQRQLQNEIYENLQVTSLRVEQLVAASNGEGYSPEDKPGQTAVLQARAELLGTLGHETNNLIALRAARFRAEHNRHAEEESVAAFNRAQREEVMADWPSSNR